MLLRPTRLLPCLALVAGLAAAPAIAPAQNLFAPAITVNEQVITNFELEQRTRMLEVLNAPGNPRETARADLVDDRLRLAEARRSGISVSEEQVLEGMAEFAGRADLSREEFLQALAQGGVEEETFRDFVRAGIAWRELIRQRFGPQADVTEIEIDRGLQGDGTGSNVRVLLSEIIIPAPPQQAARARALAEEISTYRSEARFSAAAREYSATASRERGGRLDWQPLTELPPPLRPILRSLSPGEVTDPLPIQNGVALFQLRAIEEAGYDAPEVAELDYAAYYIPGGRSPEALARARVIASQVDRCDDLYGVAQGQPERVLERRTAAPSELPTDVAFELSKLDPGETSAALTRSDGQTLMLLMLCARSSQPTGSDEDVEARREQVTGALRNRRVQELAENFLAELRANAVIVER